MEYEGKSIIRIPFDEIVNTCVQQKKKTEVNIELNTDNQKPKYIIAHLLFWLIF